MNAVKAAHAYRKPWAEIAVTLGVSHQSARERWHELDEMAGGEPESARDGKAWPVGGTSTSKADKA